MTNTENYKSNLRNKGDNWIGGTVGRFTVIAKVFEEGSQYGMPENDRISKLWITASGDVVFNYDRGLDVSTIDAADLAAIVAAVTK